MEGLSLTQPIISFLLFSIQNVAGFVDMKIKEILTEEEVNEKQNDYLKLDSRFVFSKYNNY